MNIASGTAVQLVCQPTVNSTESQVACFVDVLDCRNVLEEPQKSTDGGVGRQRKTATIGQLSGANASFEAANNLNISGIGPDNGVVQGLSSSLVPDYSGLTLVGNTNGDNLLTRVTLGLELLNGTVNALLDGGDDLLWVMLVPAVKRVLSVN